MTPEDKQLLIFAAKAEGTVLFWDTHNGLDFCTKQGGGDWNPLEDDGDALRLAVKLRIELKFGGVSTRSIPSNVAVSYPKQLSSASERQILLVEQYVPDDMFTNTDSRFGESDRRFAEYYVRNYGTTIGVMRATRRAIVRAAAEMGRIME